MYTHTYVQLVVVVVEWQANCNQGRNRLWMKRMTVKSSVIHVQCVCVKTKTIFGQIDKRQTLLTLACVLVSSCKVFSSSQSLVCMVWLAVSFGGLEGRHQQGSVKMMVLSTMTTQAQNALSFDMHSHSNWRRWRRMNAVLCTWGEMWRGQQHQWWSSCHVIGATCGRLVSHKISGKWVCR